MKSLFADRSILYEKTAIKAFNLRLPFLECCKMQHLFDVASVQKGNSLVFNVSVLLGAIRIPNSRFRGKHFSLGKYGSQTLIGWYRLLRS